MKMNYKEDKFVQLSLSIVSLALSIVSLVLSVFIIMVRWNWYIHPLGAVTTKFIWVLGIGLFVDFIFSKGVLFKLQKNGSDKNGFNAIVNNLFNTAITFLFISLLYDLFV